tara:strand:- start:483 stop:1076 length:594 start_codon:yes stop_codon:yes gene_type:complete
MALTKSRDYVSVKPTTEAVTVEQARLHLDLDDNFYDQQLSTLISVATQRVQQDSRRSLITQTRVMSMDAFPSNGIIELPTVPVQSVSSITYVDGNDATQTLSSSLYLVDSNNTPSRVVLNDGESWPNNRGHYDDVKVTYVAGYGDTVGDVDEVAKYAMLMLVSHLFNSPSVTSYGTMNIVPIGYERLIESLKWGQYP